METGKLFITTSAISVTRIMSHKGDDSSIGGTLYGSAELRKNVIFEIAKVNIDPKAEEKSHEILVRQDSPFVQHEFLLMGTCYIDDEVLKTCVPFTQTERLSVLKKKQALLEIEVAQSAMQDIATAIDEAETFKKFEEDLKGIIKSHSSLNLFRGLSVVYDNFGFHLSLNSLNYLCVEMGAEKFEYRHNRNWSLKNTECDLSHINPKDEFTDVLKELKYLASAIGDRVKISLEQWYEKQQSQSAQNNVSKT